VNPTPSLKARKLTPQQAVKLLATFYAECGPEEMGRAFAWDRPPQQLARDDTLYEFSVPGKGVVGFGKVQLDTRDASDTEAGLTIGVLPAHRRQGYWHAIVARLVKIAERLGADIATQIVYKENAEHCARVLREAEGASSPWFHAGTAWYPPPGYEYFVCPITEDGGPKKGEGESR
jgi:GNAT superfamily N-acetyltransferase